MNTETNQFSYLLTGQAVSILETLQSGGFLVCSIYEDPETGEPIRSDERPFRVDKVWSKPPTELLSAEVKELQDEINELEEKRSELHNLTREERGKWSEITAKLAKYKALEHVLEFAEGKITHYVIDQYSTLSIVSIGDTKAEYSSTNSYRLLSLFGESKGDLQWKLHQYADGSGNSKYDCWPARSLEEAQELAASVAAEKFETEHGYRLGSLIKSCDALGITVPESAREELRIKDLANLRKSEEDMEKKLADVKGKINALTL